MRVCVSANRPGADPGTRVLLIEADGRNRNPWIRIPVGHFKTIGDPCFDWRFQTEPEPHPGGWRLDRPRGRGLGGFSPINGLTYVRGQQDDFDAWGRVAPVWSFANCLPCLKYAEYQERGQDRCHGAADRSRYRKAVYDFEINDHFVAAAEAFGLPLNPDCNGETQEGAEFKC